MFILLLSGTVLFVRRPKAGRRLIIVALIILIISGLEFLPNIMFNTLEKRVQAGKIPERIDGIIILAGAVDMESSRPGLVELTDRADRIIEGVILARKHPEARLILTGGSGDLEQDERLKEADYLEKLSLSLGIDKARLTIERNSRNTHEHALEMSKMLSNNGKWVLITSAFHMPRSLGCFKKERLNVIPYPVDYKTKVEMFDNISLIAFFPSPGNLSRFSIAIHEWLGLVAYRFMSYTGSIFPEAG